MTLKMHSKHVFSQGKVNVLLSTDVAARGIHIKRLKYVVNYDFPSNIEQYCHRIGRCGRQGEEGFAYSLMTRNFAAMSSDLIELLQSCRQHVEPNLVKLAEDFKSGLIGGDEEDGDHDDDDDDGKQEDEEK